jgi:uncharacterized cupin superfamily protein
MSDEDNTSLAVHAKTVPPSQRSSSYPEPFFSRMAGREKRPLGDRFGLKNFGVNLTTLLPGGESALMHRHSVQDEFVFVLEGRPTLVTDKGEQALEPGMCVGFAAGGVAHHLVNRTDRKVVIIEVGDRNNGDEGTYPTDDLKAMQAPDGTWLYVHKDGRRY